MKQSFLKLSAIALVMGCCAVRPAEAYVIPIASMVEWPQEIMLLFESEVKRWEHEAIKYKELLYTDMMGKQGVNAQGDGSLEPYDNEDKILYVIGTEEKDKVGTLKTDSKFGASSIRRTRKIYDENVEPDEKENGKEYIYVDKDGKTLISVDELTNYSGAKSKIESNYVIQQDKFKMYSEDEYAKIQENQRIAVNNLAKSALATSAIETVVDTSSNDQAKPETAAQQIARATDMNAMFELMVAMDQRVYEKSLRMSNMEATSAELKAMQSLQGLSKVNPNKEEEEKE